MTMAAISESQRRYLKKRYEGRKAAGLCVYCGREKAAPGRVSCAACARSFRERYDQLVSQRLCVNCRKPLKDGWTARLCFACTMKRK